MSEISLSQPVVESVALYIGLPVEKKIIKRKKNPRFSPFLWRIIIIKRNIGLFLISIHRDMIFGLISRCGGKSNS